MSIANVACLLVGVVVGACGAISALLLTERGRWERWSELQYEYEDKENGY